MVRSPTTGTSKRMSWPGRLTLATTSPGAGDRRRPLDGAVGPFHGLDGDHGAVLDAHRLADVQGGDAPGLVPGEIDIPGQGLLMRRRGV